MEKALWCPRFISGRGRGTAVCIFKCSISAIKKLIATSNPMMANTYEYTSCAKIGRMVAEWAAENN